MNRESGTQGIYRNPASLRNAYSLQNYRLVDQMDQVMDTGKQCSDVF